MIRLSSPVEWADTLTSILRCNVALPTNIAAERARVVGFSDEAAVRQDPGGLSAAVQAAKRTGESGFFIVWAGLETDLRQGDSAFVDMDSLPAGTDFVGISSSLDPELCFRDRWVAFSPRSVWAIYGEQYGAELAVFVIREHVSIDPFQGNPVRLLSAPEVVEQLVPDNSMGAAFASVFVSEYCS